MQRVQLYMIYIQCNLVDHYSFSLSLFIGKNQNNSERGNTKGIATPPFAANNNNNKASLDIVNFMAETTKVRLLRGYIFAGETRQLSATDAASCKELVLQPFWQAKELTIEVNPQGVFQLQEQFAIINDEKFLQSVERQQLLLELRPLGGQVRLPLHQFFIAYRDAAITNHLCKGKVSAEIHIYTYLISLFRLFLHSVACNFY